MRGGWHRIACFAQAAPRPPVPAPAARVPAPPPLAGGWECARRGGRPHRRNARVAWRMAQRLRLYPATRRAKSFTIPRQGMRVSRLGVDVNPVRRSRHIEAPDQSLIIGKQRALPGDKLFHEHRRLGCAADEAPNLIEVPVIIEHIGENHGVPYRITVQATVNASLALRSGASLGRA